MVDNRSAFEVFDNDGDGFLTQQEAGHVLRSNGYNPSQKQLAEMCAKLPNPSHISSAEYARLTMTAPKPPNTYERDLIEAFRVFDREENGLINENDLRVVLTTLGECIDLEDVNALMQQVAVDDQGKVKYADFVKIIMQP